MAYTTWIMKDILPNKSYSSISTEVILGRHLCYETPSPFIMKAIIMRYFKLMSYLK